LFRLWPTTEIAISFRLFIAGYYQRMNVELIPIIDPSLSEITIMGFAERKAAERNNLVHLTTIIIPICANGLVQLQIRPLRKSYSGCRDFFGGHVSLTGHVIGCLLGIPFDLEKFVTDAATREANEELRLHTLPDRLPCDIAPNSLVRVGKLGDFPCDIVGNRERSTVFLYRIPDNGTLAPMDDIDGRFVPVETEFHTFEEIVARHKQNPQKNPTTTRVDSYEANKQNWQFADGAGRILSDEHLTEMVRTAIVGLAAA
jgi:hypothetical protein